MKIIFLFSFLFLNFLCLGQVDTNQAIYAEIYTLSIQEYDSIELEMGHYIQTENVRMHYITFGEPSDTPLVWIHGTGSSSWEMLSFKDSLLQMGFYVISIDYYGHGQTPMPITEKSIYHIADDVHFLMNHLAIEKAVIGGWSRGGYIAAAFYDEYPTSVLGLVLVDGGSANALVPRYQMDRDSLRAKYQEAQIPLYLLTTYETRFAAFCAFADTQEVTSQSWILDGLKKGQNGQWGYTSDVWKAVANNSVEAMLAAVESPTLAPLLASSTYLLQPLSVFRNLSVPIIIIDPVTENETWQDYTSENAKLKKLHPEWVTHQIYKDTNHGAHFQRPEWFYRDLRLMLVQIQKRE